MFRTRLRIFQTRILRAFRELVLGPPRVKHTDVSAAFVEYAHPSQECGCNPNADHRPTCSWMRMRCTACDGNGWCSSCGGDGVGIDREFWSAYERLSRAGHCDAAGGAESHRVHVEWVAADRPADVDEFIQRRANVGPTG